MRAAEFDGNAVLWALAGACQFHRIPFDSKLVLQQFPPPHTLESVREALAALGFRSGVADPGVDGLSELSGPGFLTVGNSEEGPLSFVLLLRCDGERILFAEPGSQEPREASLAEFAPRYAGQALSFAPEAKPVADPDVPDGPKEFGFAWFVPELLKHRAVWRDVLLASLAIQLVGLATPLFTQVVIDKVVVQAPFQPAAMSPLVLPFIGAEMLAVTIISMAAMAVTAMCMSWVAALITCSRKAMTGRDTGPGSTQTSASPISRRSTCA
ncbi:MAG: hypothetical protein OHM77_11075 [Candidatus Nitricoxidivorans perseverans]|uniref:Peptidase C39 domain-containing protein n=1 Tax=Candidatus Nitricoxidivorans perseverans TaxID=2975601 RepID=A0AA49FKG2_9PROT|nr:MAG: hypothetical protein OHM77_11075 [Candidatus Nitricoxidivorans perseverans]